MPAIEHDSPFSISLHAWTKCGIPGVGPSDLAMGSKGLYFQARIIVDGILVQYVPRPATEANKVTDGKLISGAGLTSGRWTATSRRSSVGIIRLGRKASFHADRPHSHLRPRQQRYHLPSDLAELLQRKHLISRLGRCFRPRQDQARAQWRLWPSERCRLVSGEDLEHCHLLVLPLPYP